MDILVIEDDPVIGKSLNKGVSEAGHDCVWVKDGERGLEQARTQKFDAIVLDLLLPWVAAGWRAAGGGTEGPGASATTHHAPPTTPTGLDLLRRLRSEGIGTPVVLLTALGSVEDRVAGLNAGADDYVVKPFALVELLARIEAVRRRTTTRPPALLQVGDLTLDLALQRVSREGVEIDLTPTEFSLLEMLMRYKGQVVTRKMLCEHIWAADWEGATNVIEVHINRLRGKLQRGNPTALIQTVRGRGYVLRAP